MSCAAKYNGTAATMQGLTGCAADSAPATEIVHVYRSSRVSWWGSISEDNMAGVDSDNLAPFREESMTGSLHRGLHPDPAQSKTLREIYGDQIDKWSIYWYERGVGPMTMAYHQEESFHAAAAILFAADHGISQLNEPRTVTNDQVRWANAYVSKFKRQHAQETGEHLADILETLAQNAKDHGADL